MFAKLEGYLLTPQMLLYTLAYRILGQSYSYKLGTNKLYPLEDRTPYQRAFVLLFPPVVLGVPGLILCLLWVYTAIGADFSADLSIYPFVAPLWHQALVVVGMGLVAYASGSAYMVPFIIKLLREGRNQQQQQTTNYLGNRDSNKQTG
ncbi:hypothetical protein KFU94_00825 [Chloroflexi bacterium TSY]|nr:hypothetical protein [Chloroflexi bacterium TSY]